MAEDSHAMVGFGHLQPYPDATELGCVGVLHERRRQGRGKLIIDELIRRGPEKIWITTDYPDYFKGIGFEECSPAPAAISKKLERFRDFAKGTIVAMCRRNPDLPV